MKIKPSKKPKIRKTWNINPGTRVMQGSKKQMRLSAKEELRNIQRGLHNEEKGT
ncbi:MAG: hypothetical protein P9M04_04770 [Candidatus Orphnella occulta]|nr:hypothetical protein [Candidatus Orphnella occulta]